MRVLATPRASAGPSLAHLVRRIPVVAAFVRQGFKRRIAYRAAFGMQFLNTLVKVFGLATVWSVLYTQAPASFPVNREETVTYAVVAALSSELLGWWDGPHRYIAGRARSGLLVGDLLRPISFPFQMFAMWLGESLVVLGVVIVPAAVVAATVFDVGTPASPAAALAFVVSSVLAFVLLFCINFVVGTISVLTLSTYGLMTMYHGVIALFSGLWIPLWFYPAPLKTIAGLLPFKAIYFVPLSTYVGYTTGGAMVTSILGLAAWTVAGTIAVWRCWHLVQRRLVIQGG
jgi:ABC-2 type transport system permease protein